MNEAKPLRTMAIEIKGNFLFMIFEWLIDEIT